MAALFPAFTAFAGNRPNIVFFIVDDMGWVDSQVPYGDSLYANNLRINTPNMLRLARQSVVMSSAYACPVSTPTRTSLLSGMNAAHTHITNWTSPTKNISSDGTGGGDITKAKPMEQIAGELMPAVWNINGMSPEPGIDSTQYVTPLPRLLRDAGYFTIHVGKAHWASAGTPGASPYNMGFIVNVSGNVAGMPRSYQSEDNYGNTPEKWTMMAVQNMCEYYGTGVHLTEALTREALKTLDYPISHGEPFYLYMAHYATHTPIQKDDRFFRKYRDAGMDAGQAKYASMVEGVDKSLGDIMDYLEARGVADNTVIIFMTDNGGNSENKQKGGILHTQNLPLREGKGSVYEGGIRVPLMFSWKGRITPGTRIENPVSAEDLFPTILDIAGVKNYECVQDIDGQDLVRLLTKGSKAVSKASPECAEGTIPGMIVPENAGGTDPERPVVMHYPHQWKPYFLEDIDYLSSVRVGDWKLVYRMRTETLELYNLSEDIGERHDLAQEYPDKVRRLAGILSDKLRSWNASMPFRPDGTPVPMPDEVLQD